MSQEKVPQSTVDKVKAQEAKINTLKQIENLHALLTSGQFKGSQAQEVFAALTFVASLHNQLKTEIEKES